MNVDDVAPPTIKLSDARRHASLLYDFLLDNSLHISVNEIRSSQGVHYWNFRNHVRLKNRFNLILEGKNCKFVRSTIALEICPNMIICKTWWQIIPPL
jgi:hypothetical protein